MFLLSKHKLLASTKRATYQKATFHKGRCVGQRRAAKLCDQQKNTRTSQITDQSNERKTL